MAFYTRSKGSIPFFLFLFLLPIFCFRGEKFVNGEELPDFASFSPSDRRGDGIQKIIEVSGKMTIGHSLYTPNEEGGLYYLENYQNLKETKSMDHLCGKLKGEHRWQTYRLSWTMKGLVEGNDSGWQDTGALEEAYLSVPYNSTFQWLTGKKAFSWGTSRFLNPMSFLSPMQNPFDDEWSQEGIILLGGQYAQKFPPGPDPLQELTFTPIIFPVKEQVNEDFGQKDKWNMAGHLSLLFWNTELEFCLLKGESKPERFGFSFSRGLNNKLEFHGNFWLVPEYEKIYLDYNGQLYSTVYAAFGSLYGFTYKFNDDLSCSLEMYRNKEGFTSKEIQDYYVYLHEMYNSFLENENSASMERIALLNDTYFLRPLLMQEYLYGEIQKKNFLELSPLSLSLRGVYNLQDQSYAMNPKITYSSKPESKIEIKGIWWGGQSFTEFGEKANEWMVDISLVYFFDFSLYHLPKIEGPLNEAPSSSWR